jgi:hypothetical protein
MNTDPELLVTLGSTVQTVPSSEVSTLKWEIGDPPESDGGDHDTTTEDDVTFEIANDVGGAGDLTATTVTAGEAGPVPAELTPETLNL